MDGWEYKPLQRERPVGSKAKDVVLEERPVDKTKTMGRPVDVKTEKPMSGAMPVDDETYKLRP